MKKIFCAISIYPLIYFLLYIISFVVAFIYLGNKNIPYIIILLTFIIDYLRHPTGCLIIIVVIYYLYVTYTSNVIKNDDKHKIYLYLVLFNAFYLPLYWHNYVRQNNKNS